MIKFRVGDKVRLKRCIDAPRFGWALHLNRKDIGTIDHFNNDGGVGVVFSPHEFSWAIHEDELDLIERPFVPDPPDLPEKISRVVDAVRAGDWGCQRAAVIDLVSAIVGEDISEYVK